MVRREPHAAAQPAGRARHDLAAGRGGDAGAAIGGFRKNLLRALAEVRGGRGGVAGCRSSRAEVLQWIIAEGMGHVAEKLFVAHLPGEHSEVWILVQ